MVEIINYFFLKSKACVSKEQQSRVLLYSSGIFRKLQIPCGVTLPPGFINKRFCHNVRKSGNSIKKAKKLQTYTDLELNQILKSNAYIELNLLINSALCALPFSKSGSKNSFACAKCSL